MLKAFGKSDADIRRYRNGKGVVSSFDRLLIKGLFGFKAVSTIDTICNDGGVVYHLGQIFEHIEKQD